MFVFSLSQEMFCFVGLQAYLVLKSEIVYGACWSRNPAKPIVRYRSSLPSKLSSHQVVLTPRSPDSYSSVYFLKSRKPFPNVDLKHY